MNPTQTDIKTTLPRWLIGTVLGVFAILAAGGAWFYQNQRNQLEWEAERHVLGIAQLKVNQIVSWRSERLGDAKTVFSENPFFLNALNEWMDSEQKKHHQELLATFRSVQSHFSYSDVLLANTKGEILLSLTGRSHSFIEKEMADYFADALRLKRPVMTELLSATRELPARICVIAPLTMHESPFAAIVLVCDAQRFLFPLIQSWPIQSASAESLLVRRDGDAALLINDVRHRRNLAFKERIPLTRKNVPAVMTVLGYEGVIQGTDYRGAEVFAAIRAVPGTSWFLIAKIDTAEALKTWHFRAILIIGMTLVLFVAATAIAWAAWQHTIKESYRLRTESEQRYAATLMSIGDAVIVTDEKAKVRILNPVAESLTGWKQRDAQGKPIEEVFNICNEYTRQGVQNPIQQVIEKGQIVGLTNPTLLISKNGKEYPILDSSSPVRNSAGDLIGVVLVFRDQTEERTAERLLQAEKSRLQTIMAASPVGLIIFDATERIVSSNAEADRMFRQSQEYLERPRCGEFLGCINHRNHPEGCGQAEKCQDCKLIAAIRDALHENRSTHNLESELLAISAGASKQLFVNINVEPVTIDGRPHAIFAVSDISQRKQLELQLRNSVDLLNATGSTARIGGWELDPESGIGYWTDEMYRIFGVPMGQKPSVEEATQFYHPADREQITASIQRALNHGEGYDLELRFISAQNTCLWVHAICNPVVEDGKTTRLVGTFQDITERRQAKEHQDRLEMQLQQAMKMEAVGRLAGGIAHDFNNLLTGVIGYSDLIISSLNPEDPMLNDLKEIQKAARSAADLAGQLLVFSRKQLIEPKVINLNSLISSLHRMLVRLIGEDVDLQTIPCERLDSVKVDPGQFEQILVNLAVNARDAMPNGGKLTIETSNIHLDESYCAVHSYVMPGNYVMLAVSDSGQGMSSEVKSHLFEPFFTTKPKGRGTGLGLATIYGAVKQSGGSIEVYSEEGKGTAFKIYIPSLEEEPKLPQRQGNLAAEEPSGTETILVVEDEPIVRELAIRILKRLQYNVLHAADGKEAIAIARQFDQPIHLLMTDVVMPGMNGRVLADHLVLIHSEMKVLYTSGYTENAIAHHGVIEENLNFIGKPYSPRNLAKKIRSILDES